MNLHRAADSKEHSMAGEEHFSQLFGALKHLILESLGHFTFHFMGESP